MNAYIIDDNLNWKSLPWNKINEKIFLIQKKIYKASQRCDVYNTSKLQLDLINCNEIKIIAIEKVCKDIINNNKEKYFINNKEKHTLFQSLFKQVNLLSSYILFIREKISQYILYLCIKPEWEARFEPIIKSNITYLDIYSFHNRLINFFKNKLISQKNKKYGYYLKYQIDKKYIDLNYFIYKITCTSFIKTKISNWLNNQYFSEEYLYKIKKRSILLFNDSNNLFKFFIKIFYTGIEWYSFYDSLFKLQFYDYFIFKNNRYFQYKNYWIQVYLNKSQNYSKSYFFTILEALGFSYQNLKIFYIHAQRDKISFIDYFIKNNQLINILKQYKESSLIEIKQKVFNLFLYKIKNILYHKNLYEKWRPNINSIINECFKIINFQFIKWYQYYDEIISKESILEYYQIIDLILYKWIKKYFKDSDIHLLKINQTRILNLTNESFNVVHF